MEPDKTNQKRERQLTREQRSKASTVAEDDIIRVYEHWLLVMRPHRKGRRPMLDDRRRLKVAAAIFDYGVDQCLTAIDGCAKSDFHMGRNKMGRRYDDLELIFRDQDHVEKFLSLGEDRGEW